MLFSKKNVNSQLPSDYQLINETESLKMNRLKKPNKFRSDYKGRMFYEAPNYFNLKPANITPRSF